MARQAGESVWRDKQGRMYDAWEEPSYGVAERFGGITKRSEKEVIGKEKRDMTYQRLVEPALPSRR